jgi:hypothetical protein
MRPRGRWPSPLARPLADGFWSGARVQGGGRGAVGGGSEGLAFRAFVGLLGVLAIRALSKPTFQSIYTTNEAKAQVRAWTGTEHLPFTAARALKAAAYVSWSQRGGIQGAFA